MLLNIVGKHCDLVNGRGGSRKFRKGGTVPQFWKEGAEKRHLNVHFSVFLINLL